MVKIRLLRTGAKKQAKYRIVVTDQQKKRSGGFIEIIGNYNPTSEPPEIKLDKERFDYWVGVGAQPTKTTAELYKKYGKTS